jgi:prevent-host-death family protein
VTDSYSLYEAKARLSALIRLVREGLSVTITVHGEPVAELRPYQRPEGPPSFEDRIAELTNKGELLPAAKSPDDPSVLRPGKRVPGALRRFLKDRE